MKCLKSQEMRKLAPELDPLRIGTGWKPEELAVSYRITCNNGNQRTLINP